MPGTERDGSYYSGHEHDVDRQSWDSEPGNWFTRLDWLAPVLSIMVVVGVVSLCIKLSIRGKKRRRGKGKACKIPSSCQEEPKTYGGARIVGHVDVNDLPTSEAGDLPTGDAEAKPEAVEEVPDAPLPIEALDLPEGAAEQMMDARDRMLKMAESPLVERKALFRDLQLQSHPDKNPKEDEATSTAVFQYIVANRKWFLREAGSSESIASRI
eukprot:gnl/TRDRNA2_/TRDRNA2_142248_c0_seq1.p1 gnl/TRDRNA2_/TRDRNA2_142248_c0~~gnl/TRDRNA2_/TRDRNA2_142248_c0_seq1.p1  ORF type:complete len:212 (+),score=39.03 gnl/TRDRNA2_/TRDRNA2_142248_c0_seq1:114-749(+)